MNAKIALRVWNEITPILQEYYETRGEFALAGMPYTKARERIGQLISGISEGGDRIEKIVTGLKNFSLQNHGDLNQSMKHAGGNQTIAAQMLGLSRRALNNRLRRSHP